MAKPIHYSSRATFAVPREKIWEFLADTDRLNRAIGLPVVNFQPLADPEDKGRYVAETRILGRRVAYDEFPFDWIMPRYYRVERRFPEGPIAELKCGVRFFPAPAGTELEVFADIVPRNWLGSVVSWLKLRKKATHSVLELARRFEAHARDAAANPPPAPPPPSAIRTDVLEKRLGEVKAPGPVGRLKAHLETAADLDVVRMRPFELADRWGEDRMRTLRLFLAAAKAGVLDLAWSVLCPTCHIPTRQLATLSEMRSQAHCETCNVRFGADLASSVEARFAVNGAVRTARREVYCIGGPANTPHVVAQLRIEPRETRKEEIELAPGVYRFRSYQAPGKPRLTVPAAGGGETLRLRCGREGLAVEGEARAGISKLEVVNELDRGILLILEQETWKESAATAALVTTLQDFRDSFPGEAVAPGEEIGVASLALLFTDLKDSTDFYRRVGDVRAFAFVQNHFRYLVEKVAANRGGVVKTMGDAIMAAFASAGDAVSAALEMQRGWAEFRKANGDPPGVELKAGIHQGPAIAINNAGVLDYFGSTANMAARVQAQSAGADVVFSQAVREDPAAARVLAGREVEEFRAALKGLGGEHALFRVRCGGTSSQLSGIAGVKFE